MIYVVIMQSSDGLAGDEEHIDASTREEAERQAQLARPGWVIIK